MNQSVMKTSYILLAIIAILTLTGMVATDVLLKQQYDNIDWRNQYQNYEKRDLPRATHWVLEGTSGSEIIIEHTTGAAQALLQPEEAKNYSIRQQGDTVFVTFKPSNGRFGENDSLRHVAERSFSEDLLLRIPKLTSINAKDARITVRNWSMDRLTINLRNTRLQTHNVVIADSLALTVGQNSFSVLSNTDQYKTVQAVVQDSSGIQINDTPIANFTAQTSPKAEVRLSGQALKWLK